MATIIFLPVLLILLQPDVGSSIVFFSFILVLYREGLTGYMIFFMILFGILSVLALLMNEINMVALLVLTSLAAWILVGRSLKLSVRAGLIFIAVSGIVMAIFRIFSPQTLIDIQLIVAAVQEAPFCCFSPSLTG
jgi:rod shape determining protein RodA